MNKLLFVVVITILLGSCKKEEEDSQVDQRYQNLKVGYHFDDFSSGKAVDFGPGNYPDLPNQKNDATPFRLEHVDGKYGKSVEFYNEESSLSIPYGLHEFQNSLVIDFWINLSQGNSEEFHNIIGETMAGSASTFRVGISNDYIRFDFLNNPIITEGVISTQKLEIGIWTHIAFIYTGTDITLYINGEPNVSKAILMGDIDSWNNLYMGFTDNYYDYEKTFYGKLDEFRVWDYNFESIEVKDYLMVTYSF